MELGYLLTSFKKHLSRSVDSMDEVFPSDETTITNGSHTSADFLEENGYLIIKDHWKENNYLPPSIDDMNNGYSSHREVAEINGVNKGHKESISRDVSIDDERFVHINSWYEEFGVNPCSRTETIYVHSFRSEEPVTSNMDISTGHIVLVSKHLLYLLQMSK